MLFSHCRNAVTTKLHLHHYTCINTTLQHGSRQFCKNIVGLGSYQKTASEYSLGLCSGERKYASF